MVQSVQTMPSFPPLWSCLRHEGVASGQPLPADPSWQEAILFLLVSVKFFYFLRFTVSLSVCCDMVVLACSLEHKILSLQTAGLWYSTWRLTASHIVSAFDGSTFVPAAGFGISPRIQILRLCASQQSITRKLSNVVFIRWEEQTPTAAGIVLHRLSKTSLNGTLSCILMYSSVNPSFELPEHFAVEVCFKIDLKLIAKFKPPSWRWRDYWWFTGSLSAYLLQCVK